MKISPRGCNTSIRSEKNAFIRSLRGHPQEAGGRQKRPQASSGKPEGRAIPTPNMQHKFSFHTFPAYPVRSTPDGCFYASNRKHHKHGACWHRPSPNPSHTPPRNQILASSRSHNQEISRLLWNVKVHYRVHWGSPMDLFEYYPSIYV
jgi:hypothetical protein